MVPIHVSFETGTYKIFPPSTKGYMKYKIQWRPRGGTWMDAHTYSSRHVAEKIMAKEQKKFKNYEYRIVEV